MTEKLEKPTHIDSLPQGVDSGTVAPEVPLLPDGQVDLNELAKQAREADIPLVTADEPKAVSGTDGPIDLAAIRKAMNAATQPKD